MFESLTYETILSNMLARIPNGLDRREGAVIYDALSPIALELANYYIQLDAILNETFADTSSLNYLIKRAEERGITQILATKSVAKIETTPAGVDVPLGNRFTVGNLTFSIIEKLNDGEYEAECETEGTDGNRQFGLAIPIDYVEGLESATLTEILIPARDDETEEELRERYFASFNSQAYGGNIADYKEKCTAINGVGGVKVIPVWNGGGTVKLIVIDSEFTAPSQVLLDLVETTFVGNGTNGEGFGLAPIGHVVTVDGVEEVAVDITAEIVFDSGTTYEDIEDNIKGAIDTYFLNLAKTWEDSDYLTVRRSALISAIINVNGVSDVTNLLLDGGCDNVVLDSDEIGKRGDLIVT